MVILSNELFYQGSLKKYCSLMPYITHPETRDITLNLNGMIWVNFNLEGFSYASVILREQIAFLINDIMHAHNNTQMMNISSADHLFLKRKNAGFLRLDDENHHNFYEDGILDLTINSHNEGSIYVNILSSKMYIHYIEFSYYIGVLN